MYLLREIKVVVSGIKSIHSLLVWLISGTVYLMLLSLHLLLIQLKTGPGVINKMLNTITLLN